MLLLLQESGIDLSKVVIIDPFFDGGDLARKWTAVQSNIPLSKVTDAIKSTCPSCVLPPNLQTDTTTKLIDVIHLFRQLLVPVMKKVQQIQGTVLKANYSDHWTVHLATTTIAAKRLIFATGSEPKTMDIPIPSLPLENAIDANRLQHYIKSGSRVIVFGTMHSGTLVIRNLVGCGAHVTAFYTSPQPFYWARDGDYDGIKEEAAQIADDIVGGKIPVDLIPSKDTAKLIRASTGADWVVYAMGFQARNCIQVNVDDVPKNILTYNNHTGALECPSAWGFGIAYPNAAPDGIHFDVGVPSFLEHMKAQIPSIISDLPSTV
jgi:hypothetical protein